MRVLESLPIQLGEFAPLREMGSQAIKQALETHMEERLSRYLGHVRREPGTDRRNGATDGDE
jgi:hypothetical protein